MTSEQLLDKTLTKNKYFDIMLMIKQTWEGVMLRLQTGDGQFVEVTVPGSNAAPLDKWCMGDTALANSVARATPYRFTLWYCSGDDPAPLARILVEAGQEAVIPPDVIQQIQSLDPNLAPTPA